MSAVTNDPTTSDHRKRWWQRRPTLNHTVAVITAVLAAYVTYVSVQQGDVAECQARVNAQFTAAIQERSEANETDDAADTAADRAILRLARSIVNEPQTTDAALRRYVEDMQEVQRSRRQADRQRAEHPLPDLPEETCGDVE